MRKTNTASPSPQRQARRFACAALLCALALSACSPSIPQGAQWTDDPFRTDSSSSAQAGSASAVAKHTKVSGDQGIPRGSGTLRIAYAPAGSSPPTMSRPSRPQAATPLINSPPPLFQVLSMPISSSALIRPRPLPWARRHPPRQSATTRFAPTRIAHGFLQTARRYRTL